MSQNNSQIISEQYMNFVEYAFVLIVIFVTLIFVIIDLSSDEELSKAEKEFVFDQNNK